MPQKTDPLLALEHYHRYLFASRFAQDKRILDLGCGEGYGSAFLAQRARSVTGVDADSATIEHARQKYGAIPNLSFQVGRCEAPLGCSDRFDMVVSFELLEHLDAGEQESFLRNVGEHLAKDGLFVVSTPETTEYATICSGPNEFHKHEMTLPELRSFLEHHFEHLHLCAQRVLSASAMWQLDHQSRSPFRSHLRRNLLKELRPEEQLAPPLYLVAVCSHAPLPGNLTDESNSFYLDVSSSDQAKEFPRWAMQLEREIRESREAVRALQQQILDQRQQLEERAAWALSLDSRIKEQDEVIESLQGELESRTRWVRSLQPETSRPEKITSSSPYRIPARLGILPR